MKKGKIFIVDGTDGSGKQTQTEALYERLLKEGHNVRKITFPNYESPACQPVKMYLNGDFGTNPEDVNAYVASTFYAVDRFASYKMDWGKFYEEGGIIISDRYTTSNMIHQAVKMEKEEREAYLEWLTDLEFTKYGLPKPDGVIFLNVDSEYTQKLMENRLNKINQEEKKDIHESDFEYLRKSYLNSLEIAEKYNWNKIDCIKDGQLRTIEDISDEIYKTITSML
ncbi:dTMP kinase [Clostridium disporicum]|uniref:dTMP kinase n=1 Tax=Clostridium disporicum TaxID=84024 RepID=UPI0034A3B2AA